MGNPSTIMGGSFRLGCARRQQKKQLIPHVWDGGKHEAEKVYCFQTNITALAADRVRTVRIEIIPYEPSGGRKSTVRQTTNVDRPNNWTTV